MSKRYFLIAIFCAVPGLAQPKAGPVGAAPATQNSAEKQMLDADANWIRLTRSMEDKISRLLPCDPSALSIIQETGKASDDRMAALTAYLKAQQSSAAATITAAKAMLEEGKVQAANESQERTDTEQERAGIESRIGNLSASIEAKPALAAARTQLQELQAMVRDRAALSASQVADQQQALGGLELLVTALENRQASLGKQALAMQDEQARWKGYYAARSSRARVECQVTGGGPAPSTAAKSGAPKAAAKGAAKK